MASAVLEKSSKNLTFGNGALLARQQLTTHDLKTVSNCLSLAPQDITGATRRSLQQHRFPAMSSGAPLLVDEGLKLPISLATALQTAALYQALNWNLPINRRYIAIEFFRQYSELLLKDSLKLALTQQIGLNIAASNLVITVLRGQPTGLQMRRLAGVIQNSLPLSADFEIIKDTAAFYQHLATVLLEQNLRPIVAKLIEICNLRAEVLWDVAIETIFTCLDEFTQNPACQVARAAFLVAELNPGERLIAPAPTLDAVSNLARGHTIYLKRHCCEKFKRNRRCDNCPGTRRP